MRIIWHIYDDFKGGSENLIVGSLKFLSLLANLLRGWEKDFECVNWCHKDCTLMELEKCLINFKEGA